jgi:hypothetical protein
MQGRNRRRYVTLRVSTDRAVMEKLHVSGHSYASEFKSAFRETGIKTDLLRSLWF